MNKICTVIFSFALLLTFTLPASATPANPTVQDIQNLKLLNRITHMYHSLQGFGELIESTDAFVDLAYDEINLYGTTNTINRAKKDITVLKDYYQKNEQIVKLLEKEVKLKKLNISDAYLILNQYNESIEHLNSAIAELEQFYTTRDNAKFTSYLNLRKKAVISKNNGMTAAQNGYARFYSAIQNY